MKKIAALFILTTSLWSHAQEIDSTDAGKMSAEASKILSLAEINMIGAKGAVQISQIADQSQLQFSKIIIKQNDEIIRLLRKMTEKK